MHLILHSYPQAAENIAYEEWLFNRFEEPVLRLWVNPTSVIVGKHQNALAEANYWHCVQQAVPIIRRISGGGTVFHDGGNINFSFFKPVDPRKMINYEQHLVLIKDALNTLGYPVIMNERHDLYLGDHKISGNAQHLRRGKALHHGTILYDANRDLLSKCIKRDGGTFIDKGVKSVRSPVINLRNHKDLGSTEAFLNRLVETLASSGLTLTQPSLPDSNELKQLRETKYQTDDWNFGYSPRFKFIHENKSWHLTAMVARNGLIEQFDLNYRGQGQVNLMGIPEMYLPSSIQQWVQEQALTEAQKAELLSVLL